MNDQLENGTVAELEKPVKKEFAIPLKNGGGIAIPPMKATGSLTVENKDDITIVDDDKPSEEGTKLANKLIDSMTGMNPIPKKKEKIVLPKIGTKFMIEGKEYKVNYINEGKARFTAIPCQGVY